MAKGHVRKRGKNSWEISVYVGKDETGKDKYARKTVHCEKKKDAEKIALQLAAQVAEGRYVDPSKITVAEFLKCWLEDYAKPNVKQKTYETYEMLSRVHIIPALGDKRVDKLRPEDIRRFYAEKLSGARADGKPGTLSPTTVKHIHEVLRAAFRQAVADGNLPKSPLDSVKAPRVPKKPPMVWTPEQAAQFLAVARGHRLYAAFLLALTTGMRRGEILGLRWQDVDLENGYLMVQQELIPTKEGLKFDEPKTESSRRLVALSPMAVEALREHWKKQIEEKTVLQEMYQETGLVFTKPGGGPIAPRHFNRQFDRLVKKAGVPKIRLHDTRHTHATLLLLAGVNTKIVSERLGHADVTTTLRVYSHVLPTMQRQAAQVTDVILRNGDNRVANVFANANGSVEHNGEDSIQN